MALMGRAREGEGEGKTTHFIPFHPKRDGATQVCSELCMVHPGHAGARLESCGPRIRHADNVDIPSSMARTSNQTWARSAADSGTARLVFLTLLRPANDCRMAPLSDLLSPSLLSLLKPAI